MPLVADPAIPLIPTKGICSHTPPCSGRTFSSLTVFRTDLVDFCLPCSAVTDHLLGLCLREIMSYSAMCGAKFLLHSNWVHRSDALSDAFPACPLMSTVMKRKARMSPSKFCEALFSRVMQKPYLWYSGPPVTGTLTDVMVLQLFLGSSHNGCLFVGFPESIPTSFRCNAASQNSGGFLRATSRSGHIPYSDSVVPYDLGL